MVELDTTQSCHRRFNCVSILVKKWDIFVDLLWKSMHFVDGKFEKFWNSRNLVKFELLFQMVLYHRENVRFWWLTQRWIAQILNFSMHFSVYSLLSFPLISWRFTVRLCCGSPFRTPDKFQVPRLICVLLDCVYFSNLIISPDSVPNKLQDNKVRCVFLCLHYSDSLSEPAVKTLEGGGAGF